MNVDKMFAVSATGTHPSTFDQISRSYQCDTVSSLTDNEKTSDDEYVNIDTYRRPNTIEKNVSDADSLDKFSTINMKFDEDLDEIKAIEVLNNEMRCSMGKLLVDNQIRPLGASKSNHQSSEAKKSDISKNEETTSRATDATSVSDQVNNYNNKEEINEENDDNYHRVDRNEDDNNTACDENTGKLRANVNKIDHHFNYNSKLQQRYTRVKSASRAVVEKRLDETAIQLEKFPTSISLRHSLSQINRSANRINSSDTTTRSRAVLNDLPLRNSFKKSSISQKSDKIPISVDTSKAGSNLEVVRLCLNELKWNECADGSLTGNKCDICWLSSTYHEGYHNNTLTYNNCGKVNKFPCMNQLLRKGPLTLALNVLRSIYSDQYDFCKLDF
jgi:hypothetical protein